MSDTDTFLEHFGVKGMKWGVHNDNDSTSSSKPKVSRKELRATNKAAKTKFYEDKAHRVIDAASKDPEVLIQLKTQAAYPTVVTGREFIQHLSKGGVMDVQLTDVYATKDKKQNAYVLNENRNERFKKQKR